MLQMGKRRIQNTKYSPQIIIPAGLALQPIVSGMVDTQDE
jgi:hypothetical protein